MRIILRNQKAFFLASNRILQLLKNEFSAKDQSNNVTEFFEIKTVLKNGIQRTFGVIESGLFPQIVKSNSLKWYQKTQGLISLEDERTDLARFERYVDKIKDLSFVGKYAYQKEAVKSCDNYLQIPNEWNYVGLYASEESENLIYFPKGIINVTTGGGKTVIMTAMMESCNPNKYFRENKMLVLINRKMSFNSLEKEFVEYLGRDSVGVIDSDNVVLKDLTLCMYESLNNKLKNEKFRDKINKMYNILVIDECHYLGATNFQETLSKLTMGNVYGFSGTPFSENYDLARKQATIQKTGEELYRYSSREAVSNKINLLPVIRAYKITHKKPLQEYANHVQYFNNVVAPNQTRNQIIAQEAKTSKYLCLVAFNYIAHGKSLLAYLKEKLPNKRIAYVDGSTNSKDKKIIFDKANNLQYDILLASSCIKDAVNIKCIDKIVATFHTKSDIWFKQLLGRGLRPYKDLTELIYVDFYDSNLKSSYKNAFSKRLEFYDERGCDVYTFDAEEMKKGNLKPSKVKLSTQKKYSDYAN